MAFPNTINCLLQGLYFFLILSSALSVGHVEKSRKYLPCLRSLFSSHHKGSELNAIDDCVVTNHYVGDYAVLPALSDKNKFKINMYTQSPRIADPFRRKYKDQRYKDGRTLYKSCGGGVASNNLNQAVDTLEGYLKDQENTGLNISVISDLEESPRTDVKSLLILI